MSANRVLLVEDEEIIRDLLKEILESMAPCTILEAENGQDAIKVLESNQVDFMISDLAMPIMGGLDLFENLRSKGINIPTIVITGMATKEVAIKALRLCQTLAFIGWCHVFSTLRPRSKANLRRQADCPSCHRNILRKV